MTTRRGKNKVKYKFSGVGFGATNGAARSEATVKFKGRGGSTTKGKVTLFEM